MNLPDPLETTLAVLVESTADLVRAAETGDLHSAGLVLTNRQAELAGLERALQTATFTQQQLKILEQLLRQGDVAMRSLLGRRETARAQIAELECLRRQLAGWIAVPAVPALDTSL